MKAAPRAVSLVSGGPDSAVAAALARAEGYDLYLLFVDYGQRARARELACAHELATYLGARELRSTRLDWLAASALTIDGPPLTIRQPDLIYVPFRNSVLLSLAVAWAEAIDGTAVFIGSIGPPWATPDNSPAYFDAFQELVRVGARDGEHIVVRAPLCTSSKLEVVGRGLELGVPFERTWSCQNYDDLACGQCTSCSDRLAAFAALELADPLAYRRPLTPGTPHPNPPPLPPLGGSGLSSLPLDEGGGEGLS